MVFLDKLPHASHIVYGLEAYSMNAPDGTQCNLQGGEGK